MLFNKGNKMANEIDMVAGQVKAKCQNVVMTLKTSDMIEAQFTQLVELAKRSGDAQMVMQFEMLKQLMDNMQNNVNTQMNDIIMDLNKIDALTDKVQNSFM